MHGSGLHRKVRVITVEYNSKTYVDAFCGRVPKSVLARRYSDLSPEKLREIYEQAGLRVLD